MNWIVRRGDQEFPCESIDLLKQWTREGRVIREDYVYNPVLQQWLYARDAAELQPLFGRAQKVDEAKRLNGLGLAFGIGGILVSWVHPPFGVLLFVVGLVLTVGYYVKRPG